MAERKNITQPVDWWAAFEQEAKNRGETLSAFIGKACQARLGTAARKKLSKRPPANRPKELNR